MLERDPSKPRLDLAELHELSDVELVRLLIAGDEDAMSEIFERYYRLVMRVALQVVHDTGEAQDVVQNVFTEFYQRAALFDPSKGSLKTWLLQYSYGRSINRKRSLQLRSFYNQAPLEMLDAISPGAAAKIFDLESPEANRLVEQMLAALNDRQRRVIEMIAFRGLTLAETAKELGESLGNIQHIYYRGLEKLRQFLKAADEKVSRKSETKHTLSLLRRLRRMAKSTGEDEVEIVKARAL